LLAPFALQDAWSPQVIALVGLIAWVRGTALQNAIAADLREIMFAGHGLLSELRPPPKKYLTHLLRARDGGEFYLSAWIE